MSLKTQSIVVAGQPARLPACAAIRFVPLDGACGYPRNARIGSRAVVLTGPDWWTTDGDPDGLSVAVEPSHIGDDTNAYFLGGTDPNYLAVPGVTVPERWAVECVSERCDALPLSPPVPVWSPVFTLRGTAVPGANQCTPVFDTSAFSRLAFRFDTLAGGYSVYLYESGARVVVQQVAQFAISSGSPLHAWMGMDSPYAPVGLTMLGNYVRGRGGLFFKFPAGVAANTIVIDVFGQR